MRLLRPDLLLASAIAINARIQGSARASGVGCANKYYSGNLRDGGVGQAPPGPIPLDKTSNLMIHFVVSLVCEAMESEAPELPDEKTATAGL